MCCWKRVFAMTSLFSWQNSVSFCPASLCTPRPNLPVTPGISWLPTFAFHSPTMNRTSFVGVSSRRSRQHIKKQRHYFDNKGLSSQSYGFSSSHALMWELDHKEGWAMKNWCLWNVLEKTLESPLDSKEVKPVNPKGKQPWIFFGRIDAEAEAPILWPPDVKSQLIGKDPYAGKDWGQEEKGAAEDEMVG